MLPRSGIELVTPVNGRGKRGQQTCSANNEIRIKPNWLQNYKIWHSQCADRPAHPEPGDYRTMQQIRSDV